MSLICLWSRIWNWSMKPSIRYKRGYYLAAYFWKTFIKTLMNKVAGFMPIACCSSFSLSLHLFLQNSFLLFPRIVFDRFWVHKWVVESILRILLSLRLCVCVCVLSLMRKFPRLSLELLWVKSIMIVSDIGVFLLLNCKVNLQRIPFKVSIKQ